MSVASQKPWVKETVYIDSPRHALITFPYFSAISGSAGRKFGRDYFFPAICCWHLARKGYPPFVKDVINAGAASPCLDSASLYGTAGGGVLGNETPFSIVIRRWLANQRNLRSYRINLLNGN